MLGVWPIAVPRLVGGSVVLDIHSHGPSAWFGVLVPPTWCIGARGGLFLAGPGWVDSHRDSCHGPGGECCSGSRRSLVVGMPGMWSAVRGGFCSARSPDSVSDLWRGAVCQPTAGASRPVGPPVAETVGQLDVGLTNYSDEVNRERKTRAMLVSPMMAKTSSPRRSKSNPGLYFKFDVGR